MVESALKWGNSVAKAYLDRGGSKAGSHSFLDETQGGKFRDHLPTGSHYLPPDGDLDELLAKLDDRSPKIVRPCHPLDFYGMVDVIRSLNHSIKTKEEVRKAILEVLQWGRGKEVASYMEYETGTPFDRNIGILVQDFYPQTWGDASSGSIIEHPHQRGFFRISDRTEGTYDSDGVCTDRRSHGKDTDMESVIKLYRKVQESGLIPSSHSFQMEWVKKGKALWVVQNRLFKPFEKPGDFEVTDKSLRDPESTYLTSDLSAFGITGSEGTEPMPRAELTLGYEPTQHLETVREFIRTREKYSAVAYAHNGFDGGHVSCPLEIQPRNLSVYLPYHPSSVLVHGDYRWMQKAKVTLGGLGAYSADGYYAFGNMVRNQSPEEDVWVKVISNGITGALCFVK